MMQLLSRKELAFLDELASLLEMYNAIIVSRDESEVDIIVRQEGDYDPRRNSIRVHGSLSTIELKDLLAANKYELSAVQKEYKLGGFNPGV